MMNTRATILPKPYPRPDHSAKVRTLRRDRPIAVAFQAQGYRPVCNVTPSEGGYLVTAVAGNKLATVATWPEVVALCKRIEAMQAARAMANRYYANR